MKVNNEDYNYTCKVNDQEFNHKFKIIARFIESLIECPICGSEECCGAKDKFIWAEFENEKFAIHFGDGEFEKYLSYWHYDGISEDDYISLPNFIKDFNEGKGWDNDDLDPNSIIDALDFKKAMDVIKNSKYLTIDDDFLTKFYPIIIEFVDRVINQNKMLNILKY